MLMRYRELLVGALLVPLGAADLSPLEEAVSGRSSSDLVIRDGTLQKRLDAVFNLDQTLENEVLFDGNSQLFGLLPIGSPPVSVVCTKCCTTGNITASLNDPTVINPILRFDMRGVSAFVLLDVKAKGGHTFDLPLFRTPPNPLGIDIPGGPKLGLVFEVDLIFNFAASVDLQGGFFFKLPDTAFFEATLLNGTVSNIDFNGMMHKTLPITVNNSNGTQLTFQVDLQLKAQVGIDLTTAIIPGLSKLGAQAAVGIYANIFEFIAELSPQPTCALQATETVDLNVGAFLEADIKVANKTLGLAPTVSTTLLQAVATQCLITSGVLPTRTGAVIPPQATDCITANATVSKRYAKRGLPALTTLTALIEGAAESPTTSAGSSALAARTTSVLTFTTCGMAVVNCPDAAQTVLTVTRTICGAAAPAGPGTGVCPAVTDATSLTSLATPITATLGNSTTRAPPPPPPPMTSTAGIGGGGGRLPVNSTFSPPFGTATGSRSATATGPLATSGADASVQIKFASSIAMAGLAAVAALI